MTTQPNKSLKPTPVGVGRWADAGYAVDVKLQIVP